MSTFELPRNNDDLREIIKTAFDADLDISGDWGYTQKGATIIHTTNVPVAQFEHMFASMRAYIEMNMTLEPEDRYASINLNETDREVVTLNAISYDKVSYQVTAMNEQVYNAFINAYKAGYGKEDFDMTAHFNQRKEATLTRTVIHWFQLPAKS